MSCAVISRHVRIAAGRKPAGSWGSPGFAAQVANSKTLDGAEQRDFHPGKACTPPGIDTQMPSFIISVLILIVLARTGMAQSGSSSPSGWIPYFLHLHQPRSPVGTAAAPVSLWGGTTHLLRYIPLRYGSMKRHHSRPSGLLQLPPLWEAEQQLQCLQLW